MEADFNRVLELLVEILEVTRDRLESIPADEDLRNYGLDSCRALQFFAAAEDECGIRIHYEDLQVENISTRNKVQSFWKRYYK